MFAIRIILISLALSTTLALAQTVQIPGISTPLNTSPLLDERLRAGVEGWVKAQAGFEGVFGKQRSSELRALLHAVSASELEGASPRGLPQEPPG